MATSSSDDKPTAKEAFKANLAPKSHPVAAKVEPKREPAPEPAPTPQEREAELQKQEEAERKQHEDEIKAARKGSPVDGLHLPEKQGEVLWQQSQTIGERGDLSNKEYQQRWQEAEVAMVASAANVMAGPGGIKPNGYQLIREESAGVMRLLLVSADPKHPDPKLVGGLPNPDGTY